VSERKRREINVKEKKTTVGTNEGLRVKKWEERESDRERKRKRWDSVFFSCTFSFKNLIKMTSYNPNIKSFKWFKLNQNFK